MADALGRPRTAAFALLDDGTAVVEVAEAIGLAHLAPRRARRDGRLERGRRRAAARRRWTAGARRIVVGLGGSATVDGGLGLLRALGCVLRDGDGARLAGTGADLARLAAIDRTRARPAARGDAGRCSRSTSPARSPARTAPRRCSGRRRARRPSRSPTSTPGWRGSGGCSAPAAEVAGAGAAGGLGAALAWLGAEPRRGRRRRDGGDAVRRRARAARRSCLTGEGSVDAPDGGRQDRGAGDRRVRARAACRWPSSAAPSSPPRPTRCTGSAPRRWSRPAAVRRAWTTRSRTPARTFPPAHARCAACSEGEQHRRPLPARGRQGATADARRQGAGDRPGAAGAVRDRRRGESPTAGIYALVLVLLATFGLIWAWAGHARRSGGRSQAWGSGRGLTLADPGAEARGHEVGRRDARQDGARADRHPGRRGRRPRPLHVHDRQRQEPGGAPVHARVVARRRGRSGDGGVARAARAGRPVRRDRRAPSRRGTSSSWSRSSSTGGSRCGCSTAATTWRCAGSSRRR